MSAFKFKLARNPHNWRLVSGARRNDDTANRQIIKDSSSLILSVQDTGPGIPVEEPERIFERFYRIAGNEVQGSGLGLAIVKQIAEGHGAVINIAAGENGAGAIFSVKFPLFSLLLSPG